jgi:hypothetical protein
MIFSATWVTRFMGFNSQPEWGYDGDIAWDTTNMIWVCLTIGGLTNKWL